MHFFAEIAEYLTSANIKYNFLLFCVPYLFQVVCKENFPFSSDTAKSTVVRLFPRLQQNYFPRSFLIYLDKNAASTNKKMEGTKRVNDTTGAAKGATKKKRNRSHFTQIQLKYLDDVFSRQQYLTRDERALLAGALDMTELQIRNWFQNRRYQLRHRGLNRARQVPVKVLVSSMSAHSSED